MIIEIDNRCSDFDSYRAARVKSLFNVESGADFQLSAELPIDGDDWRLGVVVGPSGSGKTSIGRELWDGAALRSFDDWPRDAPIIDAIAPGGDFDAVTKALAAVGLGSVPAWLRPYSVLSNGERFRADLARIICEAPDRIVIDEFTSVVDRQVAQVGSAAFAKAWRAGPGGQCVLLSCHYDILDWLEPDWIYDTATGTYTGRGLHRRPNVELRIHETNWQYWPMFECHHYLKLPLPLAAFPYLGVIDGTPVAHAAVSTRPGLKEARIMRIVVMPEWQGIGIGLRFINAICAEWLAGRNRYDRRMPTLLNTSHPGLLAALRRDENWIQVSKGGGFSNKRKSARSIRTSDAKARHAGYGGHFRSVLGFRYLGEFVPHG